MDLSQPQDEDRDLWDRAASAYDDEPDHGLRPPQVLRAWTGLLKRWLPGAPAKILDMGCGTGSLSVVISQLGHPVVGIDLSTAMIDLARAKAKGLGLSVELQVMDATAPGFAAQSFDGIVCRHLLWMFPDPARVLERWVGLLKPEGRLILIEGYWHTGAGTHAPVVIAALPPALRVDSVLNLSDQPDYWGKLVSDERYGIMSDLRP